MNVDPMIAVTPQVPDAFINQSQFEQIVKAVKNVPIQGDLYSCVSVKDLAEKALGGYNKEILNRAWLIVDPGKTKSTSFHGIISVTRFGDLPVHS